MNRTKRKYTYVPGTNTKRPDDQVTLAHAKRRIRDGGSSWTGSFYYRAREFVLDRDGCCQWCGATEDLGVDHIVERQFQPDHSYENLQALCRPCHYAKTNAYRDAAKQLVQENQEAFQKILAEHQDKRRLARIATKET